MRRWIESLKTFFLQPASPAPLAALRIGIAVLLIAQALLLAGDLFSFVGPGGILQGGLNEALLPGLLPNISVVGSLLSLSASGERSLILTASLLYLASLVALALGWRTRLAALAVWGLHTLLLAGHSTSYGVDTLAHVFLFYLLIAPCGDAISLDRLTGRSMGGASTSARISLRLVQLHLCLLYFASGLEKASGVQWWNGDAIWRSLMLPTYRQYDFSWMASVPSAAVAMGVGTLILEIGYPFFIWKRPTRGVWVLGIVGLHLGIVLFLGLTVFGLLMAILTAGAFGVSADPVRRAHFNWSNAVVEGYRNFLSSVRTPTGKLAPRH